MPISARAATRPRSTSSFTGADNRLNGEGTTPEQSWPSTGARFHRAAEQLNKLEFVTLNGAYQATDDALVPGQRLSPRIPSDGRQRQYDRLHRLRAGNGCCASRTARRR
jgi:hypothetical protein